MNSGAGSCVVKFSVCVQTDFTLLLRCPLGPRVQIKQHIYSFCHLWLVVSPFPKDTRRRVGNYPFKQARWTAGGLGPRHPITAEWALTVLWRRRGGATVSPPRVNA